jgi:uncharacterized cupin superfamily protein
MTGPTSGGQIAPGTLSPDRSWVWTGGGWAHVSQAQYSPDREYVWSGTQWLRNSGWAAPRTPNPAPPIPNAAAPTPNTRWGTPRSGPQNLAFRKGAIVIGFVLAVIFVLAGIGSAFKNQTNTARTNTSAAVSVAPTPTPSPTQSPTPSPTPKARPTPTIKAPTVLLDKYGNGTSKTAIFQTTGEWTITYDFDCTAFGFAGNFQIYVFDGNSALTDLPVNSLSMKGTDTIYEHNLSGPYYLEMNSECNWHVIVNG